MGAISLAEHPASAKRRQAALRSPCGEHALGSPAATHMLLNQLVKPVGENGTPRAVLMKVRSVLGASASARASSGWIGTETARPVFLWRRTMRPFLTC